MSNFDVIQAFLGKVSGEKDEKALKATKLTPREMELFLGVLNSLPENSLQVPNMSVIVEKVGVSPPYIQKLKSKNLVKNGPKRGEWLVTEFAVKKMAKFVGVEFAEASPEPDAKTPNAVDLALSISDWTIQKVKDRIKEIDMTLSQLQQERKSIVDQLRNQMATIK